MLRHGDPSGNSIFAVKKNHFHHEQISILVCHQNNLNQPCSLLQSIFFINVGEYEIRFFFNIITSVLVLVCT